jgi:hypothetical protein
LLRKLSISKQQKFEILALHNVIAENNLAKLSGFILSKGVGVANCKIKLQKYTTDEYSELTNKIFNTLSGEDGSFSIEGIEYGNYKIVISNKIEGYEDLIENIEILGNKKLNFSFTVFSKDEVVVSRTEYITTVDIRVLDLQKNQFSFADIEVFTETGQKLELFDNLINKNNTIIELPQNELSDEIEKLGQCEKFVKLKFKAVVNTLENTVEKEICLKNARKFTDDKIDNKLSKIVKSIIPKFRNVIEIVINNFVNYEVKIQDKETKLDLDNLNIKIYKDKDYKNLEKEYDKSFQYGFYIKESNSNQNFISEKIYYEVTKKGYKPKKSYLSFDPNDLDNEYIISLEKEIVSFKLNVFDKSETTLDANYEIYRDKDMSEDSLIKDGSTTTIVSIPKINIEDGKCYVKIENDGYETKILNINLLKNNTFDIELQKIKSPKEITFNGCTRITRKLYTQMREIVLGNRLMEDLDKDKVSKLKTSVENSVYKYYKQYLEEKPDFEKKVISSLMNVTPEMKIFELKFTPKQIRDIYGESKTMSLNNTIKKVIFESSEKKNLIREEKKLIKNRFLFSINDLNLNSRRQFNESKKRLNNESINLIRRGYNQKLVKETLLDVMQSLYGGDGKSVITDFKTKLGEKIATQVKNKEEEHNMILSAFNELPEDMVERAIKENRVDELSSEIATRAMEMYKGQYGTEGLSGLMFASVDENKFKQEVAKLLEPAINDITTKMDEKFKEIQNAVGGITKTA